MLISFLKYVEWKLSKDWNATGKSLLWSTQTLLDINYKTEHHNHSPAAVTKGKKGRGRMAVPATQFSCVTRCDTRCSKDESEHGACSRVPLSPPRHQAAQPCSSKEVTESLTLKITFVFQSNRAQSDAQAVEVLAQTSMWNYREIRVKVVISNYLFFKPSLSFTTKY